MIINRNNYEQYCIDYLEGKLSPPEMEYFLLFLSENPDIKQQLEEMEVKPVNQDNISFADKEYLKKGKKLQLPVNRYNFNDFCIAYTEDDLSDIQKDELKKFIINNPSKSKDFELFTKSRFQPDNTIRYQYKGRLKRHNIGSVSVAGLLGIAASIVVFLVIASVFSRYNKSDINHINKISISVPKNQKHIAISQNITKNSTSNKVIFSQAYQQYTKRNIIRTVKDTGITNLTDSVDKLSSDNDLNPDRTLYVLELNIIPARTIKLINSTRDTIDPMNLLARSKPDSIINNYASSVIMAFVKSKIQQINDITGNYLKFSNKKGKSRKIISFETPLIGFYQSKNTQ